MLSVQLSTAGTELLKMYYSLIDGISLQLIHFVLPETWPLESCLGVCMQTAPGNLAECDSRAVCFTAWVEAIIPICRRHLLPHTGNADICPPLPRPPSNSLSPFFILLPESSAVPLASFPPSVFSISSSTSLYHSRLWARRDGNWVGGLGCRIRRKVSEWSEIKSNSISTKLKIK